MENTFLTALFNSASAGIGAITQAGINKTYQDLSETTEQYGKAVDLMEAALPEESTEKIRDAFDDAILAQEKQGFINGLRYGIMMTQELGLSGGISLGKAN